MKAIIVYYSMNGNVKQTAEMIAEKTGADLLALHPVKAYPDKGAMQFIWGGSAVTFKKKPDLEPYSFNASDYDLVIIGTPVWASNFTPPLRTFFENNDLTGKKIAAIATSAGGDSAKCLQAVKEAAHADSLAAALSLIDPKEKPSEEVEKKISSFIEECKAL